jgi:Fe-Mn family superoxide dismutase
MSFELPALKYNTDSLEPHIDTRTMEIHHGKHHAGYTNNLNNAIKGTDLESSSIENILTGLDLNNSAVRNNGGGFFNHSLFWNIMSPNGGGEPSGELASAIESSFGSFAEFKTLFSKAAGTRFGSGWAWLCVHKGGKLESLLYGQPRQSANERYWLWRVSYFRSRCLGTCILFKLSK